MKIPEIAFRGICLAGFILLAGCGFRPLYATANQAGFEHGVRLGQISSPEIVGEYLGEALRTRLRIRDGQTPKYELSLTAKERAQRLAVQIDATVTRYNYRLSARYTLTDLETGNIIKGAANSVTSYNIVSSQYSTLFAERTAQEKAAGLLVQEIERDILFRLSEISQGREPAAPGPEIEPPGTIDILPDPGADPLTAPNVYQDGQ